MADAPPARDQPPPTELPHGRAGEDGQPVLEVPLLVEFGDPSDTTASAAPGTGPPPAAAEAKPAAPAPSQRPPRRSFLAPAPAAARSIERSSQDGADRPPARPRPVTGAEIS